MTKKTSFPVSVNFLFDHKTNKASPTKIIWDNQEYSVSKIGLKYSYREGRTLFHAFGVLCGDTYFKLILDTDSLFWRVEEVSDK